MTILCYHAIDPDWSSPLAIDPDTFRRQCELLGRRRNVLPLEEAVTALDHRGHLPRGVTTLTFDDGFASLHEHALPVLRRLELPATVFLVAETLVGSGRAVDWVDTPPPPPRRLETLQLEQIAEMQSAGVRFASHSYSHYDLTTLGYDRCVDDLARSREVLEELLGQPVPFLAYPRGRNDATVRAAAARAGYTHSFTLPEGPEPPGPHGVPRAGVYPGNGPRLVLQKTQSAYLRIRLSPWYPRIRRAAVRVGAAREPATSSSRHSDA